MASESENQSDDDFSDEVHPKPRVTPRWALRLASALRAAGAVPTNPSIAAPTARNDHE